MANKESKKAKTRKEITLIKTKLVKSTLAPLLGVCALVTLVAAERPPRGGTEGGRLQGTWDVTVGIINCQTGGEITHFASMLTYHAGGTLMESTSGLSQALKTPGEGVWRQLTDNTYAIRIKFFTFILRTSLQAGGSLTRS